MKVEDLSQEVRTVTGQKEAFLVAMAEVKEERGAEVGGHSYMEQIERYGPAIIFAELTNIMSRLEKMLWRDPSGDINHARLQELCVDNGNYTGFLYEWSVSVAGEL